MPHLSKDPWASDNIRSFFTGGLAIVTHFSWFQQKLSVNYPFVFKSFPIILWRIRTVDQNETILVLITSLGGESDGYDYSTPSDEETERQRGQTAGSHKNRTCLRRSVPSCLFCPVPDSRSTFSQFKRKKQLPSCQAPYLFFSEKPMDLNLKVCP